MYSSHSFARRVRQVRISFPITHTVSRVQHGFAVVKRLAVSGACSAALAPEEHGIYELRDLGPRSIASVLNLQFIGRVSPIDSCCERPARLYRR